MLSRPRAEKHNDSDGGEIIVTEECEGEEKSVLEVDFVLFRYIREVESIMNSILSCKPQHMNVREQAVRV